MDPKNETALRELGAKKILAELVNVPSSDYAQRDLVSMVDEPWDPKTAARVRKFIEKYGPLRRYEVFADKAPRGSKGLAEDMFANRHVAIAGSLLRQAWTVGEDESKIELVNTVLNDIAAYREFSGVRDAFRGLPPTPLSFPMVKADFGSGTWTPKPRDLLDALVIELMHSRKMLHICERPECQRYFVKEFSRDRYCSNLCSETMRKVGQREWVRKHRASKPAQRKSRKKR